jgi:hypothetical protein
MPAIKGIVKELIGSTTHYLSGGILKLMNKPIISGLLTSGTRWLTLCLLVFCAPAHARWENVGLYTAGIYYVDTASVVREGETRKLLSLLDYRNTQTSNEGKKYLSIRTQLHIDCRTESVRTLHLALFAGPMASGALIESGGMLHEWMPAPPNTPMHQIMHKVC